MTGKLDDISFLLGQLDTKINTLSLDIAQDRAVQSQDRADMRLKLNTLTDKMEKVEEFCEINEPILQHLTRIKSNIALALFIVGSLVSGVVYLIYWGLANYWNELRAVLQNIIR